MKVHKQTFFSRNHSRISGTVHAGTRVKSQDFVLRHNSQHQVSVFTLFLLVLGKSIILYSLLSLKMAGVTIVKYVHSYISGTILYQNPGTSSCAPSMDSPYNIQHTLVGVLHCCFIAKVRVWIPAVWIFCGLSFHNRLSCEEFHWMDHALICYI